MKEIKLTQGKTTLVNDADYVQLNKFKWYVRPTRCTSYAVRNVRIAKNKKRIERMHRVILGLQMGDKRITDHIDGNGLNNQPSNLRVCTYTQNNQSRRKRRGCTSKYKGVNWNCRFRKWYSRIQINKKQIFLGCFDSETTAASAYNRAALKYFGEFAITNEITGVVS